MDQVLEAALRRKPKALKAAPPTVIGESGELPQPEPDSRVRRSTFPTPEQPPVVVRGRG